MRLVLAALALTLPTASFAQSATDCTSDAFGNVHCTTRQQQGLDWGILKPQPNAGDNFARGWQQGQRIRAQIEAQRDRRQERAEADDAQAQAKEVGALLAKGDCNGAADYALSAGNLPLAQQVKDYCAK